MGLWRLLKKESKKEKPADAKKTKPVKTKQGMKKEKVEKSTQKTDGAPKKKVIKPSSTIKPKPEAAFFQQTIRLFDPYSEGEKPIPGVSVRVWHISADAKDPPEIANKISDSNGSITFQYTLPKDQAKNPPKQKFRIALYDLENNEIHETEVKLKPGENKLLDVPVPMAAYHRKKAVPIEDLTEELGYKLPSGLFTVMKANNIETLEDIRTNKGIKNLKKLPVVDDHPDILRLEGHAHLHTISKDIHLNAHLYENGYSSSSDIGDKSLAKFIEDAAPKLEKEAAGLLWKKARKQNSALDLIALTRWITKDKGDRPPIDENETESGNTDDNKETCVCKDCDAAVSPRAYLIQLLEYAGQNLEIAGCEDVTEKLEWLSETFCLPFDEYSFSCEAMEEQVLQIRLCIEVLKCYLSGGTDFGETQKAYCLKAYETLLTRMGTSRDELRLMRSADPNADAQIKDELEALERRLGFRLLIESENRLQELYLHRDADTNEISEAALQNLFGLLQTVPGARPSSESPRVEKWRKEYLKKQWGREDRRENETAWDFPIIDPDIVGIDDIRIPKTEIDQNGSLSLNQTPPAFDLWNKRREWINLHLEELKNKKKQIQIAPEVSFVIQDMNGMFGYLKNVKYRIWESGSLTNDIKNPAYDTEGLPTLPTGAHPAEIPPDDLNKKFKRILKNLGQGDPNAIKTITEQYCFSIESFKRLLELWDKIMLQESATSILIEGEGINDDELNEIISILLQSLKQAFYQIWIDEENAEKYVGSDGASIYNNKMLFGSADFWQSITEPSIGEWPPKNHDKRAFIDPEFMEKKDLRSVFGLHMKNGKTFIETYEERKAVLRNLQIDLLVEQENIAGIVYMTLIRALPNATDPPLVIEDLSNEITQVSDKMDNLYNDLVQAKATADTSVIETAENAIKSECGDLLTIAEFETLVALKQKMLTTNRPSSKEWAKAVAIIKSAFKIRADWKSVEKKDDTLPLKYWEIIKAKLPKWIADRATRQKWQNALNANSSMPIIEPDVIFADDIKDSNLREMQRNRADRINGITTALGVPASDDEQLLWLENLLEGKVGVLISEFDELTRRYNEGQAVSPRLHQIGMPIDAFLRLSKLRALLQGNQTLNKNELGEIKAILSSVLKRRLYAHWRKDEANIILEPGIFSLDGTVPGNMLEEWYTWRLEAKGRRRWVQSLDARVSQLAAIEDSLNNAVLEAEEDALPILRSGLIDAAYKKRFPNGAGIGEGKDPDAPPTNETPERLQEYRARWVTNYFLIDAESGSCRITTRLQQSIETLQMILWSSRAGLLQDTHLELEVMLVADDFDEDWEWIGSYAAWRAAMFIFIYPENILLPSLRKVESQTPGFRELVSTLRNSRITPESVDTAVGAYSDYFLDVCDLTIGATATRFSQSIRLPLPDFHVTPTATSGATTSTSSHSGLSDSGSTSQSGYSGDCTEEIVFMIARGGKTGCIYWSALSKSLYQSQAVDSEKKVTDQTFWARVPYLADMEALDILGAQWHSGQRKCTLFLLGRNSGRKSLFFTTFESKGAPGLQGYWGQVKSLELGEEFSRAIMVWDPKGVSRPGVLLIGDEKFQFQRLNESCDACEPLPGRPSEDFAWYSGHDVEPMTTLFPCDMILYESGGSLRFILLATIQGSLIVLRIVDTQTNNGVEYKGFQVPECPYVTSRDFLGFFSSFGTPQMIWRRHDKTYYSRFHWLHDRFAMDIEHEWMLNVDAAREVELEVDGLSRSSIHEKAGTYVACQKKFGVSNDMERLVTSFQQEGVSLLNEFELVTVAPRVSGIPLSPSDLRNSNARHRFAVQSIVDLNADCSSTINTYLHEAYYYLYIHTALQLQKDRYFVEALDWSRKVYNYSLPEEERFFYPQLHTLSEIATDNEITYERELSWLEDPLDIHGIAADPQRTPPLTDQRFIIQSIVRCLLEYADSEFTFDTSDSITRARDLYLQSLSLLDTNELQPPKNDCAGIIAELELSVGQEKKDSEEYAFLVLIVEGLKKINELDVLQKIKEDMKIIMAGDITMLKKLQEVSKIVYDALDEQKKLSNRSINQIIMDIASDKERKRKDILSDPGIIKDLEAQLFYSIKSDFLGISECFCIPPNPVIYALRLHGELNLYKIRTCRNIAGMKREIEPYSAPTDTTSGMPSIGTGGQLQLPGTITIVPTQYRYAVLIERAKQLVSLAQQMEAAFLSVLEKYDMESYNRLNARQDAAVARTTVKLQGLRMVEAGNAVQLSVLQKDRAIIQRDHYTMLLEEGLLESEVNAENYLHFAAFVHTVAALAQAGVVVAAGAAFAGETATASLWGSLAVSAAAFGSHIGQAASAWAAYESTVASYERRRQDWGFQSKLAEHDMAIGDLQFTIAEDHERIVGQELNIAEMQSDFADDIVEFLNNKFTSAELYEWMSGVLEGVYRYFLQQATAMAKLAENQLAFERQETPPAYIQNDYWEAPSEGAVTLSTEDNTVDRRGLTGSSRLLMDIYKLDHYAFETDKRNLQLTKTISLFRHDPFAFQRFVESGVMVLETPMRMFDQDFPGHYLRLIKRVRTSVIALVPPMEGIRATLQSSGISRVVIGGNIFQGTTIRRDPESVALTSPQNATGLFELQQESHMMLPFEGSGVDMVWEFRMPKASNPFDFRTIADVLVTIEYTALDSYDYRQQVVKQLDRSVSADRAFSFRQQFPDQWYALNNPDQNNPSMAVKFEIKRWDFPPNIQEIKIQQVLLYFAVKGEEQLEEEITLQLNDLVNGRTYGGKATAIENLISTRGGAAAEWTSLIKKIPAGSWELSFSDSPKIRSMFENKKIEDLLFVITYSGETPEWPE